MFFNRSYAVLSTQYVDLDKSIAAKMLRKTMHTFISADKLKLWSFEKLHCEKKIISFTSFWISTLKLRFMKMHLSVK